ncbi:MAG: SDR family NAD(P)-dependent oxidoreductase, partial [Betaproteobacteria bacterium]|nr:SDR family NAD(P)-dependent oxidoreductase [Betaproteobacteria bacterium]
GIGFEFARQYLQAGWQVHATYRQEAHRLALRDIGAHPLKLDVEQLEDIAGLAWQLDGEAFDVVIMNAGVFGPRDSSTQKPADAAAFDQVMRTNVLAAMRLIPVVMPCLNAQGGTMAFISSRMGSIAEASSSYGLLYRVSKASVNMLAKLAHVDYHASGLRVLAMHPGWVRTDMGGPNADVDVQTSVDGLRRVISEPLAYPSGQFFDYRGSSLAW